MKMNIRKATINDLKAIKEIEDESFLNPFKESDLRYEINENPVSNFLVLEEDEEVIGFIDYRITFDSATIDQIAIKKDKRNQGFAGYLLENVINVLKESKEIEFFTLEVRKSNVAALALYTEKLKQQDFLKK